MRRATLLLVAGWLQDERGGVGKTEGRGKRAATAEGVCCHSCVVDALDVCLCRVSFASLCIIVGVFPCN